jgi:hypothetical protein
MPTGSFQVKIRIPKSFAPAPGEYPFDKLRAGRWKEKRP